MKLAVLTCGMLPIPAVQGGAVENLIDFYLEYNGQYHLHDITVYSVWHPDVSKHPALQEYCNHYHYIDTSSLWAKIRRKAYGLLHRHEYYNYYIEYYFERAWQHIGKQHYDAILLENRPGYAYKLSRRGTSNLVLHLHNDLLNSATPRHQEVFKSLSRILTVSDYIKSRVATIAQSDKVMTIHNGICLDSFTPKAVPAVTRQDLGFSDTDFVLVYNGRLNKEKGISELIDAMLLLQDIPNIKLMIIGSTFFGNAVNEDDFVRSLKAKAQAIRERLVFTGFVPYHQVPDYLHTADLAVLPSIWEEPFGLTVAEAQAAGLPIITTRRGGIPEVVTSKNAVLLDIGEHFGAHLADAIRQLYQSPQQCSLMAASALQHAASYDKVRYASDFFNAIESLS